MVKIKRIGVLSFGGILGIMYAVLGLIVGGLISLFGLIGLPLNAQPAIGPLFLLSTIFTIGAVIFLPLFYGLMGFLMGLLIAVIFNLVASWIGGLEIEIEK